MPPHRDKDQHNERDANESSTAVKENAGVVLHGYSVNQPGASGVTCTLPPVGVNGIPLVNVSI